MMKEDSSDRAFCRNPANAAGTVSPSPYNVRSVRTEARIAALAQSLAEDGQKEITVYLGNDGRGRREIMKAKNTNALISKEGRVAEFELASAWRWISGSEPASGRKIKAEKFELYFLVLLFVAFSLFPLTVEAYQFIELRNSPKSKLCVAIKSAVKNMKKNWRGKIMALPFRNYSIPEKDVKKDFVVGKIIFRAYRFYNVKVIFVQPRKWGTEDVIMDWSKGYYLIDMDHDGVPDLIEITGDRFGVFGPGNTLVIYHRAWIFDEKPVYRDLMPVKNVADPRNTLFIAKESKDLDFSPHEGFRGAYYIAPFSFSQRNYLLFESNEDYAGKLFWVAELLPDGKLITHCYF